jgi:hypothetical protein
MYYEVKKFSSESLILVRENTSLLPEHDRYSSGLYNSPNNTA